MMNCGVYQIEHIGSGRVYVGSAIHIKKRWHAHRHNLQRGIHHSSKLQRAWDKYGEATFRFGVLLICAKRHLLEYEQRAIDALNAVVDGFNCNPTAGSWLGRKHSESTRAKLSALKKGVPTGVGHPVSAEARAKIGAANRGRVPTEETLEKLRRARVGKTPALGMKHSPEALARVSAASKAWWASASAEDLKQRAEKIGRARVGFRHKDETRQKLSAARRARLSKPHSPETRAKIKAALQAHFAARRQQA